MPTSAISEKASLDPEGQPFDTRTYYVNEELSDLPVLTAPKGLNNLGWYWDSILLVSGNNAIYQKTINTYRIYPIFELKE